MATTRELLERYKPHLIYDRQEQYFADSAAEWTDAPGNVLLRADRRTVIAAATPEAGQLQLALELLSPTTYGPGGPRWQDGDHISCPGKDYAKLFRALHVRPRYRNRVYGRAITAGGMTRWLQYWFFYFFNDAPAAHLGIGYGKHEGDWEMVQLRLRDDGIPDRAAYAQHKNAEVRDWADVEKAGTGTNPVVYVARASHAAYFERVHLPWERADGGLPSPPLALEEIDDKEPAWARWGGMWGDTAPGALGIGERSPTGPGAKKQWGNPDSLVAQRPQQFAPLELQPIPPPPESISVRRVDQRAEVAYAFPAGDSGTATHLLVTLMSLDDKLPPSTYTLDLDGATGAVTVPEELDDGKRYQVHVSAMNTDGALTAARTRTLYPVAPG